MFTLRAARTAALQMFSGCDESLNWWVLHGSGTPEIRLSAGLAGFPGQKAREVYLNQDGHAMLDSRWLKNEVLVLQWLTEVMPINF
jgi:hypothetical protein